MTSTPIPDQFLARVEAALADGTFVRLAINPLEPGPQDATKILGRHVTLRGTPHLSLTHRHRTRDSVRNLLVPDALRWLREQLEKYCRSALLSTTTRDWQFIRSPDGTARVIDHKPATKTPPPRHHDRAKHSRLGPAAADWLALLDVVDSNGKVRASMAAKHRQIDRYLEILSHLAVDCGWIAAEDAPPAEVPAGELVVADMGCGKGYLTFGAWHFFRRVRQRPVRVIGVEARTELVERMRQTAARLRAEGLEFRPGHIESVRLDRADALIALHACDTATDAALVRGVELGCKLIVLAPCCHKEVRPKMEVSAALKPVTQHGILEERLAEWFTDGLRALVLEWAGYRTKVFEFVSPEHTAKNLMIAAIREREPFTSEEARQRVLALKEFAGVREHTLDVLLEQPSVAVAP